MKRLIYRTSADSIKFCQYIFLCVFLSALFTSSATFAQDKPKKGKIFGGLGYFSLGYTQLSLDALNTKLTSESFPGVKAEYITFGGGGHAIFNNVIIGGEGHSMSSKSASSDKIGVPVENAFSAGYGFFNIGYVLFSKKALILYPMLGIGAGGMTLDITDAPQTTSFQNIMQDHRRSISMYNGGFLMNFQLGADFVLSGGENNRAGFLVGLHGGYIYSPVKWDWTWKSATITDGPEVNMNGPYVRLTLGGGGFGRTN